MISWLAALALCVLAVATVATLLRDGDRSVDDMADRLYENEPPDPDRLHLESLAEYAARGGDVADLDPPLHTDPGDGEPAGDHGASDDRVDSDLPPTEVVPVATHLGGADADLIAGMLRAAGIPAEVVSRGLAGRGAPPRDTVVVREHDVAAAQSLIAAADAQPPEPPPLYR